MTLVFAGVKLRRGIGFGDPLESVTSRKRGLIRQTAEQYLAEKRECFSDEFDSMRFISRHSLAKIRQTPDPPPGVDVGKHAPL